MRPMITNESISKDPGNEPLPLSPSSLEMMDHFASGSGCISSENTTTAVTPVQLVGTSSTCCHHFASDVGYPSCQLHEDGEDAVSGSSTATPPSLLSLKLRAFLGDNIKWIPSGTTIAVMANIAASTAGIGSFAMPYTAYRCGVAYFIIGMMITVALMSYSQYVICHVIEVTGLRSYDTITRRAFNNSRIAEMVVQTMLIADCFGGTIATIVVVGDGVASILTGTGAVSKDAVSSVTFLIQLTAFLLVMVPLSLPRTTNALKYASALGVSAIAVVMMYAIGRGLLSANTVNLAPVETTSMMSFSVGTSLLFFGFNNQFNTIDFYCEMKPCDRTPQRFTKILLITMVMMGLAYIAMGLSELMEFGASITGNVLNSYDGGSAVAAIMIIAVLIKVTLSYPLLMFPTREALLHMVGVEDVKGSSRTVYFGITAAIAAASFGVGVVLPKIVTLFSLIGSLCVGTFAFILPSLFFWRFSILHRFSDVNGSGSSGVGTTSSTSVYFAVPQWVHVVLNVVNFVVGVFIVIAGTLSAFLEL